MREKIQAELERLIEEFCRQTGRENIWQKPVIRYGDAHSPLFDQLKELVDPQHHHPCEYLPGATLVLSYFLPFKEEVGRSNVDGEMISPQWADGYNYSNEMAPYINDGLCKFIHALGYEACPPTDIGMINDGFPRSRWSQKHVAYICGHGTFGVNNMMISDKGCVGRYYSIITALPFAHDQVVTEERCLYKKDGSCLQCVERCPIGALHADGFDRLRCLDQCNINGEKFPGADACGKCVVGLPCSFGNFGAAAK